MKILKVTISSFFVIILLISACSPDLEEDPGQEEPVFFPDQIQGEVVYIPFPVNMSVDGDLSDWNDFPAYLVNKGPLPAIDQEENGWYLFSITADLNNFCITMQMPDQNIIAGQHGTEFWNEDSMEFYINASDDLNAPGYKTDIFQINLNSTDIGNTDPENLTVTGVFQCKLT